MNEYRLTPTMRYLEYVALFLSLLIIFCAMAAIIIALMALVRDAQNYSVLSAAIPVHPTVSNYEELSVDKNQLMGSLLRFVIVSLCFSLPFCLISIFLFIFHLATIRISKMRLSPQDLTWVYPGGELTTRWENLQAIAIEKRIIPSLIVPVYLLLREPVRPNGISLLRISNRKPHQKIPIFLFVESWDSELGKAILAHAPWLAKERSA
jgi:hypothetical protein